MIRFAIAIIVLSAFAASRTVRADVTIEQTIDITAPGALSLAAMEGKTVTSIAGDRSRSDNDLKFKSKLVQRFGGDAGQTSEIVRLDEERLYQLQHEEQQYQAMDFAVMRAQTEQAVEQMEQAAAEAETGTEADAPGATTDLPVSEQQCEWSEAQVNVDRTGERQRIAGVEAEQSVVTATQTCRDPESGKACDISWRMESWLAPDVPGSAEAVEFWQAYASKLGYDELVQNPAVPGIATLFSQYEGGWDEIGEQADDLQGYPMRLVMSLDIGGAECTTDTGEPLSYEAAFGEEMQQAMGETAAQSVGESIGGNIGGSVAKTLLGAFGKKKDKAPEAAAATAGTPGHITLFKIVTETTSISTATISKDRFEIPVGYREVSSNP